MKREMQMKCPQATGKATQQLCGTCYYFVDVLPRAPLNDAPDWALHQVQQVVVGPEPDQAHHRERHRLQAQHRRVSVKFYMFDKLVSACT